MNPEQQSHSNKSVIVIGGGISGLCAAFWLKKRGIDVLVLEKEISAGGTMKTTRDNGWLAEAGPNSALETTPLFQEIFDDLHLTEKRLYANEASKNVYIFRNGDLHRLPMDPIGFLTTKLWSFGGKMRLLKEPFVSRARQEESVAEFFERKLGKEFSDYAINPFVAGIYAGKPENLSVQNVFPAFYELEEKFGGLYIGMIRRKKPPKDKKAPVRRRSFSFTDGMQTFPNAIAEHLGAAFKTGCEVERVVPMRAGSFPVYTVTYKQNGVSMQAEASAVVFACPAYATAPMIRPIDPEMAKNLESIAYSPVVQIFMGFDRKQIGRNPDGFGFLVPEKEHRSILGNLWSSAMYPGRAPEGHFGMTTFVGGARQPQLTEKLDEELSTLVLTELQAIMRITGSPVFHKLTRWKRAIPQYKLGYSRVLKAMEMFEKNFQGAFLLGNYRNGISVGDCVKNAHAAASSIVEYFHR
jgi:oxygen-dependent protoporphyrinogen oxidase